MESMKRSLVIFVAAAILVALAALPASALTKALVTDVSPDGGSADVSADSNVNATFNIRMAKSTINNKTVYLKRQDSSAVVPAQVTYRGTTETATLNPNDDLTSGATYSAYIKGGRTGVKGAGSQKLGGTTDTTATFANAKVVWTFTVAPPPPPPSTALHFSPNPLDLSYTYSCLVTNPGNTKYLTIDNSKNTEDVTVASVELTDTNHFFDGAIRAAPFTVEAGATIYDQITFRGDGQFSATLTLKDENGNVIDQPVALTGSASCFLPPPIIVG